MALKDSWLTVRLLKGIDLEHDDRTLEPGTPTILDNLYFDVLGKLSKRPGTERFPRRIATSDGTYAELSGAIGLESRDDETELVLLSSDDAIYTRTPNDATWIGRGPWVANVTELLPLSRGPSEAWDPQTATAGNVRIVAWHDQRGGIWGQLLSYPDELPRFPEFQISGHVGKMPRALPVGNKLHVYFMSGTDVMSAAFNMSEASDRSFTLHTTISSVSSSNASSPAPYDVCTNPQWDYSIMAASIAGGTKIAIINQNGSIGAVASSPSRPAPITSYRSTVGPTIVASQDGLVAALGFKDAAGISPYTNSYAVALFNAATLATILPIASIDHATEIQSSDAQLRSHTISFQSGTYIDANGLTNWTIKAFLEVSGTDMSNSVRYATADLTQDQALLHGSGTFIRHSKLASKPFAFQGRNFLWFNYPSTLQSTDLLYRDDGVLCAASRHSLAVRDVSGVLGEVQVIDDKAYRAATQRDFLNAISASGSSFSARHNILMRTTYHPGTWQPIDIDAVLHMQGGMLGTYDGTSVTEHGFIFQAEGISASLGSASLGHDGIQSAASPTSRSGPLASASFQWAIIPYKYDARGNQHFGSCVDVLTATMTASLGAVQNTASLSWDSMSHTRNDGTNAPNIGFAVYRTGPNGTTFQRVDDPAAPILNTTGSDRITWNDTISEATRAVGQVMYYQPSTVPATGAPNIPTTCARHMTYANDRLYLGDLEDDRNGILTSEPHTPGDGLRFNDLGRQATSVHGGQITGLACLDFHVIIFKRDCVHSTNQIAQQDPDGITTSYPAFELVTSDVGMLEGSDPVTAAGDTAEGIFFRSERGVRLLDRGLRVQDIGSHVRPYDSLHVVHGLQAPGTEQVRFYTEQGPCLVLDLRNGQWSTFAYQPSVDACRWDGRSVYVGSDGYVWAEDTGSYRDGSDTYLSTIELGHIPLPGLQGSSRFVELGMLGDYLSPHTLRVEMMYDYSDVGMKTREISMPSALQLMPYGGEADETPATSGSLNAINMIGFGGLDDGAAMSIVSSDGITFDDWTGTIFKTLDIGNISRKLALVATDGSPNAITVHDDELFDPNSSSWIAQSGTVGVHVVYDTSSQLTTQTLYDLENAITSGSTLIATDVRTSQGDWLLAVIDEAIQYSGSFTGGSDSGPTSYGSGSYGSLDGVYQFRVQSPRQRCQAIKLRFTDVDRSGNGGSFRLTELKLRVRRESENARLPGRKRS